MKSEQLQKFYNMAEPRSEEAIRKAEERKTKRKNKELLLQDLCARLPYNVIVEYAYNAFDVHNGNYVKHGSKCILKSYLLDVFMSPRQNEKGEYIKPYLRPMSSMPEEEREFLNKMALENTLKCIEEEDPQKVFLLRIKHDAEELAYLYEHHYDVFGLIPAGLAISTETFNPYDED